MKIKDALNSLPGNQRGHYRPATEPYKNGIRRRTRKEEAHYKRIYGAGPDEKEQRKVTFA